MSVKKCLIFFKGIMNPKKIKISEKLKVRDKTADIQSFWLVMSNK